MNLGVTGEAVHLGGETAACGHFGPAPRRSDAQGNRRKIMTAARLALAEADTQVSMAEISRRANVGMATLYRNFPGRRELLEAVYADEVDSICQAAKAACSSGSNSSELERLTLWLSRFFGFVTSKRHVASALIEHTDGSNPVFSDSRAKVTAAGLPLLDAAQRAGQVRPDLSVDQILDMVHAVAMIRRDPQYVEPILQTTLRGIVASADT